MGSTPDPLSHLTRPQREALAVLCSVDPGSDGWVDTWRQRSTSAQLRPRVNHNAINGLERAGLARVSYRATGQQKACALPRPRGLD